VRLYSAFATSISASATARNRTHVAVGLHFRLTASGAAAKGALLQAGVAAPTNLPGCSDEKSFGSARAAAGADDRSLIKSRPVRAMRQASRILSPVASPRGPCLAAKNARSFDEPHNLTCLFFDVPTTVPPPGGWRSTREGRTRRRRKVLLLAREALPKPPSQVREQASRRRSHCARRPRATTPLLRR